MLATWWMMRQFAAILLLATLLPCWLLLPCCHVPMFLLSLLLPIICKYLYRSILKCRNMAGIVIPNSWMKMASCEEILQMCVWCHGLMKTLKNLYCVHMCVSVCEWDYYSVNYYCVYVLCAMLTIILLTIAKVKVSLLDLCYVLKYYCGLIFLLFNGYVVNWSCNHVVMWTFFRIIFPLRQFPFVSC
jgi:hypothetical protein